MKRAAFVVFVISALAVFSATDSPMLEFTRLDLNDGRKLKNVVVKSYDAKNGRLLIVADGAALAIPIALVPAPFAEKLKFDASSGKGGFVTAPAAPAAKPAMPTAAHQYSSYRLVPVAPPSAPQDRATRIETPTPMKRRDAPAARPVSEHRVTPLQSAANSGLPTRQEITAHRSVAVAHAERFYRYEFRAGSDNIKVTSLEIDADDAKPVTGWSGRFRTEGKAFLEFYDSKGRSFQRTTSTFEVITETKPEESAPKVESFSRKS